MAYFLSIIVYLIVRIISLWLITDVFDYKMDGKLLKVALISILMTMALHVLILLGFTGAIIYCFVSIVLIIYIFGYHPGMALVLTLVLNLISNYIDYDFFVKILNKF